MSRNNELIKVIRNFYQKLCSYSPATLREQRLWLLRTFLVNKSKAEWVNAGFVLPTVAMVSLVVVLLTVAILFRSFERSKNASNVRVNEATLNAASPAVERARAKISKLFQDPRLPRSTPSNTSLAQVIDTNVNEFTFGDETPLKLKITNKLKTDLGITTTLQDSEREANTAWKYPVDTDNNGKFDSYTLYGIYYRTPANTVTTTSGTTTTTTKRSRIPLEARALPMDEGISNNQCESEVATSANLIDGQGWFKTGGRLKRSIFVYTTTVPITDPNLTGVPASKKAKYEQYKGNKGFAAIEYQQDRERIPINNNAVLYEDDLEIAPGAGLNINGRIFTNGNLLTRRDNVRYYLVSSDKSCYFAEENSKIIVAGNLINSRVNETSSGGSPRVDLFNKPYGDQKNTISDTNKSVPTATYGNLAAYNEEAYARRIDRLVASTVALYPNKNQLPTEVQQEIDRDMAADKTLTFDKARDEQLRIYFRRRTRRVPYAEIPFGGDALTSNGINYATTVPLLGSGETLRPVNVWVFPFDPANPTDATNFAKIGINPNGSDKIRLEATDPEVQTVSGKEERIGDRILVGNNLPQYWFDTAKNRFIKEAEEGQDITGRKWDNNNNTRKRFSQAYQLDNLGITERDDFWEKSAAQKPEGVLDIVGGMRVVTGGGIYLPNTITSTNASTALSSLATPTSPVSVWSDSMPIGIDTSSGTAPQGMPSATTPYLRMRATAVYHYQKDTYDGEKPTDYQAPIACVSSYYDPSNATTAKNRVGLPDVRLRDTQSATPNRTVTTGGLTNVATTDTGGLSNNGVVYPATSLTITAGYEAALKYQAQLKHPNGRPVNEQLQKAMAKRAASGNLTLAEQSAIDSAVCALKIFDGSISPSDAVIPHGAIMETSFLDARQVKAIDKPAATSSRTYDLDVEKRQPLEIRTTVLDLDLLRRKSITGTVNSGSDFLIPNSGIIYATREDALTDKSDSSKDVSATDFKLDPTRRPNGIMLINGSDLSRNSTYKPEEKGLILASNLPVYIQGQKTGTANEGYFNRHTQEEFSDNSLKTSTDWSSTFYARTSLNQNFACRQGQFAGCGTGETWRPASVIADSITVLSHNFKLGFRQDGDYDLRYNYDGNYTVGYDVDGDAIIEPSTSTKTVNLSEVALKMDIDGDGIADKTSVNIKESDITATVAARLNGFWENNFVTSRNFTDSNYSGATTGAGSSYFNNFVTPIQRRVTYSEYLMEICPKSIITACTADDWVVGYDLNGDGDLSDSVTVNGNTYVEKTIKANQIVKALADAKVANSSFVFQTNRLAAGTTAIAANNIGNAYPDSIQSYPRRVAFLRHRTGQTVTNGTTGITGNPNTLVLDSGKPVPLGIVGSGSSLGVSYFPYSSTLTIDSIDYSAYSTSNRPRTQANALWFKGINSTTENYDPQYPLWIESSSLTGTQQPLLVPVLQLQYPFATNATTTLPTSGDASMTGSWVQRASKTETNLVFAQGNTPARPNETNGGLENFVRYLENWRDIQHIAAGAFIQFKRSSFATAPWQVFTAAVTSNSIGYGGTTAFGYPQGYRTSVGAANLGTGSTASTLGQAPFYGAPSRFWGYDVALLTQLPDLFSQRFTTPSVAEPNEFFREVGRDDAWVKTLLCAAENSGAGYTSASDVGTGFKYAISDDQRPSACK
ncbi:hypothetical protein NIES4101_29160 [Calothrix sp. NIES-4101]|nr:hypothetical protein NIES4101_29160 [Calothrix sp. NIES-4101]